MRRTAAALSAILLSLGQAATADVPERIVVRATSVLPDTVSAVLMEVSQPLSVGLEPGIAIEKLFWAHCGGSVSNYHLQAFGTLNAASAPFGQHTQRINVQLPACAQVRRNIVVDVRPGDNPDTLLQRELGASRTTKLFVCQPDQPARTAAACRLVVVGDALTQQLGPITGRLDELAKPPSQVGCRSPQGGRRWR